MHVGGMRENKWWKGRQDRRNKRGKKEGGRTEVRRLSQLLFKKKLEKTRTSQSVHPVSCLYDRAEVKQPVCSVQWYSHTYSETRKWIRKGSGLIVALCGVCETPPAISSGVHLWDFCASAVLVTHAQRESSQSLFDHSRLSWKMLRKTQVKHIVNWAENYRVFWTLL